MRTRRRVLSCASQSAYESARSHASCLPSHLRLLLLPSAFFALCSIGPISSFERKTPISRNSLSGELTVSKKAIENLLFALLFFSRVHQQRRVPPSSCRFGSDHFLRRAEPRERETSQSNRRSGRSRGKCFLAKATPRREQRRKGERRRDRTRSSSPPLALSLSPRTVSLPPVLNQSQLFCFGRTLLPSISSLLTLVLSRTGSEMHFAHSINPS